MRSRPWLLAVVAGAATALSAAGCSRAVKCAADEVDCFGHCVDTRADHAACGACGNQCAFGASCVDGQCACPAGQAICGLKCVDLSSDALNCGACGVSCGAGTCAASA